jgi:NAD(P)-dependent dehydrogenase (short-subunit alcohol dehydrogenase family)
VTDNAAVESAVKEVVAKLGRLDVAIANAGIAGPIKGLLEYSPSFVVPLLYISSSRARQWLTETVGLLYKREIQAVLNVNINVGLAQVLFFPRSECIDVLNCTCRA